MKLREAVANFRGHRTPSLTIIPRKKWWFALSGLFIVLSLVGLLVRGLNLSIDFKGGTLLKYPDNNSTTADQVRTTLTRFGLADAEVQQVTGGEKTCGAPTCLTVRTRSLTDLGSARVDVLDALASQAGTTTDKISETDIGPTWGAQISHKALEGLIIFLVLVTLYIAFRFEWKMALSAQTALLHDLIITTGIYALVGREVTPATVIAVLTILGYSLYDTVVIFDKVQENTGPQSLATVARDTYSGVVNRSLNQVLMRSVNTSLVVLLPILTLLLFGGDTLKDFAFALFVGVASGTYSSIFVAAPMLALLKEREKRYQQIRTRAEQRMGKAPARALQAVPSDGGEGRDGRVAEARTGTTVVRQQASRPRPAKRRKTTAAKRRRR